MNRKIVKNLITLYGTKEGTSTAKKLQQILDEAKEKTPRRKKIVLWDEKDIALITYPNSFLAKGKPPLEVLHDFLTEYVKKYFGIVHILPFYPSTNDRGFSITNYYRVEPRFGDWKDMSTIGKKYRLMVDLVSNHVSKTHNWFRKFLKADDKFEDYFIWFEKNNLPTPEELSKVRRGRATPLLNPFKTAKGTRYLWTTYSIGSLIDQIDLNYKNPEVFLSIIKVFLFYIERDVDILRLDGVGGLWKELGTSCKHLPQNHEIVALFREIEKEVRPGTLLFTETTTATFEENISYKSGREAHVVYNFSVAPLLLLAYYSENTQKLTEFAKKLDEDTGTDNTFFNILDIHDGINIYSASYFLTEEEKETIFENAAKRGAEFSYRNLPDGGRAIKEISITWWSAINKEGENNFDVELQRFITSRAIAMSLKGIPGIYYLSLFGAKNDKKAFAKSKHPRDINRTNLMYKETVALLNNKNSREYKIFSALMSLIEERKMISAFHPNASQKVLDLDKRVFAVMRGTGKNQVLALHNVSGKKVELKYKGKKYELEPYSFSWNKI